MWGAGTEELGIASGEKCPVCLLSMGRWPLRLCCSFESSGQEAHGATGSRGFVWRLRDSESLTPFQRPARLASFRSNPLMSAGSKRSPETIEAHSRSIFGAVWCVFRDLTETARCFRSI